MARIMKLIHMWIYRKTEYFVSYHYYIVSLAIFVGMPLLIIGAVFLSTIIIMLPLSMIFGWI